MMKAVELQFAFHKNDEVGLKQQQLLHKPVDDQSTLSHAATKEIVQESQRSAKSESSAQASLNNDNEHSRQGGHASAGKRQSKKENQQHAAAPHVEHPYKGHHIDLSL